MGKQRPGRVTGGVPVDATVKGRVVGIMALHVARRYLRQQFDPMRDFGLERPESRSDICHTSHSWSDRLRIDEDDFCRKFAFGSVAGADSHPLPLTQLADSVTA